MKTRQRREIGPEESPGAKLPPDEAADGDLDGPPFHPRSCSAGRSAASAAAANRDGQAYRSITGEPSSDGG